MPDKKPVVWNGITYESLADAARALGITTSTMLYRLRQGYTCDADLKRKCSVMWNGVEYDSIRACAIANFMSYSGMCYRIRKGHVCDTDLWQRRSDG